jgi:hypothetical protein
MRDRRCATGDARQTKQPPNQEMRDKSFVARRDWHFRPPPEFCGQAKLLVITITGVVLPALSKSGGSEATAGSPYGDTYL